jgi:hypothetical protein
MDFTKILAAGLVVLLAAGAVTAAGTGSSSQVAMSDTGSVTNADVDATYENGTVTLTLVDEGDGGVEGIVNATVDVTREYEGDHDAREGEDGAYERIGRTDSNGTVAFDLTPENESRNVTTFEIHLKKGVFSAELEYRVERGSLSLLEEEYEYDRAENREDDDERLSVSMADARATADATLEEPPQGDWRLVEADAHEEDNYYEFEYVLVNADRPGEAEIRVHGSSGEVIKYEQDIDQLEEDEDEGEDEREDEDEGEDEGEDERED